MINLEKQKHNNTKHKKHLLVTSIFLAIIVLVIIFVTVVYSYSDEVGYNLIKVEKMSKYVSANTKEQLNQTVFAGDSLTEYCNTEKFYPTHATVNRGIAGDRTDGFNRRLKATVTSILPKNLIILIGTNDINAGFSQKHILDNYTKLFAKIKEQVPRANVVVQSLYPVNADIGAIAKRIVGKRTNEVIDSLNIKIKAMSESAGFTYVDVNSLLKDGSGKLIKEFTTDGLHVNEKAYEVISKKINPYLLTGYVV